PVGVQGPACGPKVLTILRYPTVQVMLAAEKIVENLVRGGPIQFLHERLPRLLVRETGAAVANLPAALDRLRGLMEEGHKDYQPMVASILHATATHWVPTSKITYLVGAYLDGVTWPGVNLEKVDLTGTDFSNADLQGANLSRVLALGANFRQALLRGAV